MSTITLPNPEAETAAKPLIGGTAKRVWIYQPWLDLMVGCGAWSAPLLLLTSFLTGSSASWSFAFYLLALVFNYPHFMATVYRAYHRYDEFERYRFYTVQVALLLVVTGVVAHLWYPLLPWIFTLYIFWSPWHYTGQNFGILMMFAHRAGLAPTERERQALKLSFIGSYLLLLLSFNTGPSGDALIISLGLPAALTIPARLALAGFFLVASGWALVSLGRRSGWKLLLPTATLVTTQLLWFLVPAMVELMSRREIPQTRYSSGILALLHSAQYLWITSYFQEKEARAEGKRNWSFAHYILILITGGIALFVPGPWIASRVFHVDFAASFLTFTALVSLHHFILDGAVWKLRDSRIAALLIQPKDASSPAQSAGSPSVTRWLSRLAGGSPSARAVRVAAIVLLLLWGGTDRLHFYWANVSAKADSLARAARMNPDDSAVQLRLAHAAEQNGDSTAALEAMHQAARINPGNLSLQHAYGRALIEAGKSQEAYGFYGKLLELAPKNIDALVNYGLLAQQLGHPEIARDSWQRAVDADPAQANAQYYLAQTLDREGEAIAAARHYRAYLQLVAKQPNQHENEKTQVVAALIKVADADSEAHQWRAALHGYEAAQRFAAGMEDVGLQSLALVHAADAFERSGDAAAAARSYQQALQLPADRQEAAATAADWFNYAQFLRRQHQSEKLVFACLLKAEETLGATPGEELSLIAKARKEAEFKLSAPAAAAARKDFAQLIIDALHHALS